MTTPKGYAGIQKDGFIASNADGHFNPTCSQSRVSYFRLLGCVSLVDLRSISDDSLSWGILKYNFVNPFSSNEAVSLILSPARYGALVIWDDPEHKNLRAMVVPEFEVGFPDKLPLTDVEWTIQMRIKS